MTDITQIDSDAIRAEIRIMPYNGMGIRWYRVVVEWADKTLTDDLIETTSQYMAVALHMANASVGRISEPIAIRIFDSLGEMH